MNAMNGVETALETRNFDGKLEQRDADGENDDSGSAMEVMSGEELPEIIDDSPLEIVALQTDKPTVLIIDDDPVARLTLSGLLASDWYSVVTVESADEALERLHSIHPDVILCDLVMKGINGDQFCRWIKLHGSWRYIPVIAVTRIDNSVAIAAMLDAGADDVIVKPVKARELQARVAAALRTRDRYLDLARLATNSQANNRADAAQANPPTHPNSAHSNSHDGARNTSVKTHGQTHPNARQAY